MYEVATIHVDWASGGWGASVGALQSVHGQGCMHAWWD